MTDTPYLLDLHETLTKTGGNTVRVGLEYAQVIASELRSLGVEMSTVLPNDVMHVELSVSGVRVKADLEIAALEH